MLIDINEYSVVFYVHVSDPHELIDFFSDALRLGFVTKISDYIYRLRNEIFDNIVFEKDKVIISRFWAGKYCMSGGTEKRTFVSLQLNAYELKEMFEKGDFIIKFISGGMEFDIEWPVLENRNGRDTKQMIKYYKRKYSQSSKGCDSNPDSLPDGFIRICCICGNTDKIIARIK